MGRREGGKEGEEVGIGSRVTDMVMVLYFQLPLHSPSEGPVTIVRRGEEEKEEEKGATAQRVQGGRGLQKAIKSTKIYKKDL